jgi:ribosomal protein S18 acetylase RimI-like enzyme
MKREIRPMGAADIPAVIDMMAKAFQNAVLYRYLEKDEDRRRELLRVVFEHRIPASFPLTQPELAIDGGVPVGAALWSPPAAPDAPRHENTALNEAVQRFDPAVYERWMHFHTILFHGLDEAYPAPHWSLAPIAVLPEAQGKGLASLLIRGKLAHIDECREPCLLGTQDLMNTVMYGRYGFTVIREDVISEGLKTYCLLRQAEPLAKLG